ncbi:MAG: hypothetical protein AB7F88_18285 [Pyrinomonadaceae bacterium]
MKPSENDDFEVIFVASYWHKWAKKRIYASSFGKKAIPIRVRKTKEKK